MSDFKVIQVGSHTGFSNQDWFLESKLNPSDKCIFIEPVGDHFKNLVENYNTNFKNNNFFFLNTAISNKEGTLFLYIPDIKNAESSLSLPTWADQLTSIYPNHIRDHNLSLPSKKVECKCRTLQSVVEEYNVTKLDYLIIDTEGHDKEVLDSLDLSTLRPSYISIEKKHLEGTNKTQGKNYFSILTRLSYYGYSRVYEDELDIHFRLKT